MGSRCIFFWRLRRATDAEIAKTTEQIHVKFYRISNESVEEIFCNNDTKVQ